MAEGWTCPKCGCVYAPYMPECTRCNNPERCAITTTTIPAPEERCPGCGGPRWGASLTGCPMGWHYGTTCGEADHAGQLGGAPRGVPRLRTLPCGLLGGVLNDG